MSLRYIAFNNGVSKQFISSQIKPLIGRFTVVSHGNRFYSKHVVSKNFEMISSESFVPNGGHKFGKAFHDESKPLVVLLTWLLARKKHLDKYCEIYLKKGYNIVTVSVTPWQFFWPITGTQVVAEDLLQFLNNSKNPEQQVLLHGFSVGAYLWGEVLGKMHRDLPKYSKLMERIYGQIWDSPVDVTETTKGLPVAMFPRNAFLRSTIEKYVSYHLKTFYDAATQHYLRSSQFYHTSPVRCPALFLVSKNDLIGSIVASSRAKESWDSLGMKTYFKCWEKSRHVSHLMYHRDEYINTLNEFLLSLKNEEIIHDKIQAKI